MNLKEEGLRETLIIGHAYHITNGDEKYDLTVLVKGKDVFSVNLDYKNKNIETTITVMPGIHFVLNNLFFIINQETDGQYGRWVLAQHKKSN